MLPLSYFLAARLRETKITTMTSAESNALSDFAGTLAGAESPDAGTRDGDAFVLHVDSCLTPLEVIHDACILCRNGTIDAVGGASAFEELTEIRRIERPGCRAMPGMVDTHIHGSGGYDLMRILENPDVGAMSRLLARHGVTSFVPTLLAAHPEKLMALLSTLGGLCHRPQEGAVPVGIHLEGPFINPGKRGTQNADLIRPIDLIELRDLLAAGGDALRIMTFAPELDQSANLIEMLLQNRVVPSMGHSLADEAASVRAIDAGASRCTHLFNGMPMLSQRDVGLTAVALNDDRVTIELIADGVHVNPRMIDLACRAKPRRRVVGISDGSPGAGLADGTYTFGTDEVTIENGASRRVSDGRLAGSCLTLDDAMRNFQSYCEAITELEAIACYTLNAARSIGLEDRGIIQPGKRADITVVDENWNVVMTVVAGRVVYERGNEPVPAIT